MKSKQLVMWVHCLGGCAGGAKIKSNLEIPEVQVALIDQTCLFQEDQGAPLMLLSTHSAGLHIKNAT